MMYSLSDDYYTILNRLGSCYKQKVRHCK